jgi:hypothetical protein
MADEMLARLDQLQQGARETHPRRQEYNAHNDYARYDTYEAEPDYYDGEEMYGYENIYPPKLHGPQFCIALMMRLNADQSHRQCPGSVPRTVHRASFVPLSDATSSAGSKKLSAASTDGPAYGAFLI